MYCDIYSAYRLLFIVLQSYQRTVTKYVPALAMLHLSWGIVPLILNLNTSWQWAVRSMPQPLNLCEVSFWCSLDRRLYVFPKAVWMLWRREISVVCWESDRSSFVFWPINLVTISPGIQSEWGWSLQHLSRQALGPTQPSIPWVPGLSKG